MSTRLPLSISTSTETTHSFTFNFDRNFIGANHASLTSKVGQQTLLETESRIMRHLDRLPMESKMDDSKVESKVREVGDHQLKTAWEDTFLSDMYEVGDITWK
jgi:hypothetical protein